VGIVKSGGGGIEPTYQAAAAVPGAGTAGTSGDTRPTRSTMSSSPCGRPSRSITGIVAALEEPGEVAIGEQPGEHSRFVDDHHGARAAGRERPGKDRADGVMGARDPALVQRPHRLVHQHELAAQAAAGMAGGEVLRRELAQPAGDEGQCVAEGEHERRARARGEPQRAGLANITRRHHHVCSAAERARRPPGEGHDANATGGHVRQQPHDLLGLARLRHREH